MCVLACVSVINVSRSSVQQFEEWHKNQFNFFFTDLNLLVLILKMLSASVCTKTSVKISLHTDFTLIGILRFLFHKNNNRYLHSSARAFGVTSEGDSALRPSDSLFGN